MDKNSVHYRMKMMDPGDELVVPFSRYSAVRTSKHVLRKDWGVNYIVTLSNNLEPDERTITIYRPTDEEWKARMLDMNGRSPEALCIKHRKTIEQYWGYIEEICKKYGLKKKDFMPRNMKRKKK